MGIRYRLQSQRGSLKWYSVDAVITRCRPAYDVRNQVGDLRRQLVRPFWQSGEALLQITNGQLNLDSRTIPKPAVVARLR